MQTTPSAPLDNPMYYLVNFNWVLDWVLQQHKALLAKAEIEDLQRFQALSSSAQALLVRMVMRKGELFRARALRYPEISGIERALEELEAERWLEKAERLELDLYFKLFTRAEVAQQHAHLLKAAGIKGSATKAMLKAHLEQELKEKQVLAPEPIVLILGSPLFLKIRLLFFGNLHQDWSEFVLTELGHQRYETVDFSSVKGVFKSAEEVQRYLDIHEFEQQPDSEVSDLQIENKLLQPAKNPLIERIRNRVLFELARQAQQQDRTEKAIELFSHCSSSEARLRALRLRERTTPDLTLYQQLDTALAEQRPREELEGYLRIQKRLAKKLGLKAPTAPTASRIPSQEILLPQDNELTVEEFARQQLQSAGSPVFYVENGLFNGLFALLFWPAIYAPVAGAFLHPFQSAPTDLFQEEFALRRCDIIERCLALLDNNSYRATIRERLREKQGISCRLANWSLLEPSLVELALECIPATDLKLIFLRMLQSPNNHCKGLPDLIQFHPQAQTYQLIEVKGPGDKLQQHQRFWIEHLLENGIEVSICYLRANTDFQNSH